jgi:hypothetical protein
MVSGTAVLVVSGAVVLVVSGVGVCIVSCAFTVGRKVITVKQKEIKYFIITVVLFLILVSLDKKFYNLY